jgi:hypothetical protein
MTDVCSNRSFLVIAIAPSTPNLSFIFASPLFCGSSCFSSVHLYNSISSYVERTPIIVTPRLNLYLQTVLTMDTELPSMSEPSILDIATDQLLGLFVEKFIDLKWTEGLITPFDSQQESDIRNRCRTVVSEEKSLLTPNLADDLGCAYVRLKDFNACRGHRLKTVCQLIKGRQDLHYALLDLRNANIDVKAVSAGLTVGNFIRMLRDITGQAILQCRLGNVDFSYLSPLPYLTWQKPDGTIIGPLIERTPSMFPSAPPPVSAYGSSLGTGDNSPSATGQPTPSAGTSRVVSKGYSQGPSQTPGSQGTRHTLGQPGMRNIPPSCQASVPAGYLYPSPGDRVVPPQWQTEDQSRFVNQHLSSAVATPSCHPHLVESFMACPTGRRDDRPKQLEQAAIDRAFPTTLRDPTISQSQGWHGPFVQTDETPVFDDALATANLTCASFNGSVFSSATRSLAPTIATDGPAEITHHYGQWVPQPPPADYLGFEGGFVPRTPPPAESYLQPHGSAATNSGSTMSGGSNVVGSIQGGTYDKGTQQGNTSAHSWMSGYRDPGFP